MTLTAVALYPSQQWTAQKRFTSHFHVYLLFDTPSCLYRHVKFCIYKKNSKDIQGISDYYLNNSYVKMTECIINTTERDINHYTNECNIYTNVETIYSIYLVRNYFKTLMYISSFKNFKTQQDNYFQFTENNFMEQCIKIVFNIKSQEVTEFKLW